MRQQQAGFTTASSPSIVVRRGQTVSALNVRYSKVYLLAVKVTLRQWQLSLCLGTLSWCKHAAQPWPFPLAEQQPITSLPGTHGLRGDPKQLFLWPVVPSVVRRQPHWQACAAFYLSLHACAPMQWSAAQTAGNPAAADADRVAKEGDVVSVHYSVLDGNQV